MSFLRKCTSRLSRRSKERGALIADDVTTTSPSPTIGECLEVIGLFKAGTVGVYGDVVRMMTLERQFQVKNPDRVAVKELLYATLKLLAEKGLVTGIGSPVLSWCGDWNCMSCKNYGGAKAEGQSVVKVCNATGRKFSWTVPTCEGKRCMFFVPKCLEDLVDGE